MLIVWFYVDKIFKVLKESLIELSPLRSQTPFTWKIFPSENLPTFQSNSIYSASLEKKKGKKERKERLSRTTDSSVVNGGKKEQRSIN